MASRWFLGMLLVTAVAGCSGFHVQKSRATYRGHEWLVELDAPEPQRGAGGGWGLQAALDDRVAWFYTEGPAAGPPRKVLVVLALEDGAGPQPGRWAQAWEAGPGKAAKAATEVLASEVLWQGETTREGGAAAGLDVTPVELRLAHAWGEAPDRSVVVAGHVACRRDAGVPVIACVLAGAVPDGQSPSGAWHQGPDAGPNLAWAKEVARAVSFERKHPAVQP